MSSAPKGFTTTSSHSRGFTLIELLVVISIIAILATIGLVNYQAAQKSARDGKRIGDIQEIQKALEQFFAATGYYPGSGNVPPAPVGSYPNSVNTYFQNGAVPKDPVSQADYTYRSCSTDQKYVLCVAPASMEGCPSKKCNASAVPADGCSGYVAGDAAYCASSLSN